MKTSQLKDHEYNPYYHTYIEALGEVSLLDTLRKSTKKLSSIFKEVSLKKS